MAPATVKEKVKKEPAVQYATVEQFNTLNEAIGKLIDIVTKPETQNQQATKALGDITKANAETEAVKKASSDYAPMNPAWEEKAREVLGEKLDHCELFFPPRGGNIFTVVIKNKFSNAPVEYLERHKADRRSKEIGNEGIEGVENWCKLVLSNLNRPR